MKLLYLDCFSGVSGDMLLGALLDLGLSLDELRAQLGRVGLPGYEITAEAVTRQTIAATKFDCHETNPAGHHHRGYTAIAELIAASDLSPAVQSRATAVFRRLGEAEAKVHGVTLEKIHFHEVGAVDSIVDIVGACIGLAILGIERVEALPPPLGRGFVETAHGRFPVPAPATLELLRGIPTTPSEVSAELVTPTGAALLVEFAARFGPAPTMIIEKIGYGAGSRDLEPTPNVLRAVLGETITAGSDSADEVDLLETNLDDMNPELFGDVMERLFAGGALDVWLSPIQMKKNRPGTLLSLLCNRADTRRLADLVLAHTTSFGVRIQPARRETLSREQTTVTTRFGEVRIKLGRRHGKLVRCSPEYESCRQVAAAAQVTTNEVYAAATAAALEMEHHD